MVLLLLLLLLLLLILLVNSRICEVFLSSTRAWWFLSLIGFVRLIQLLDHTRKWGCCDWKASSSSNFSIQAFRVYTLVEIGQMVPCRAIRGTSISVNSTLPPLEGRLLRKAADLYLNVERRHSLHTTRLASVQRWKTSKLANITVCFYFCHSFEFSRSGCAPRSAAWRSGGVWSTDSSLLRLLSPQTPLSSTSSLLRLVRLLSPFSFKSMKFQLHGLSVLLMFRDICCLKWNCERYVVDIIVRPPYDRCSASPGVWSSTWAMRRRGCFCARALSPSLLRGRCLLDLSTSRGKVLHTRTHKHEFVHVSRETPDVTPCHTSPPQGVSTGRRQV